MYARSTTVQARPEAIEAGVGYVRDEVLPAVREIDGCVGLSMMVDRDSGRCIVTTAWQTQEAMQRSAEHVKSMRERAAEILGGSATVEEWEIAVMHRHHRAPEGTCVRALWVKFDPAQYQRALEVYKVGVLPAMDELEGFCSASLLVNREFGRSVSSVSWDTREAMERSRERAEMLRSTATREAGADVVDVCEFELAIAHLRAPEMV